MRVFQFGGQGRGFAAIFAVRELLGGCFEVDEHLVVRRVMLAVKLDQFLQDAVGRLTTRMAKHLLPGQHLERDSTEPGSHLHARMSRILARGLPLLGFVREVMVSQPQVVGDQQDRVAEPPIGAAHELAGQVDLIALIA
jgi:hypothetical protein